MRTALLSLAALLLSVATLPLLTVGAAAQGRAPFCARMIPGYGDAVLCNYFSMAACRLDVSGRGGVCIQNPAMAYGRDAPRRHFR